MKLVYTILVLAALVYAERRLIEPRLTGARLIALVQAALVYTVLVYQEWIQNGAPSKCPKQKREYTSKQVYHIVHLYRQGLHFWSNL